MTSGLAADVGKFVMVIVGLCEVFKPAVTKLSCICASKYEVVINGATLGKVNPNMVN
jgi:hypothetical protein